MINITPFVTGIPALTATTLYVRVLPFDLDSGTTTGSLYWEARTNEGLTVASNNFTLSAFQFENRTADISTVEDILLSGLGLTRL